MNKLSRVISPGAVILVVGILLVSLPAGLKAQGEAWSPVDVPGPDEHPAELIQLTEEFRAILGWGSGVPDYAGTAGRQKEKLPEFRARLEALDTSDWSVHEKIDYLLLRSEMDRLEFDLYVWRQTSRNPSFYVNQAIRNVGRHLTGGRRMYVPELMPYTGERARAILKALADTESILNQGRRNLTEPVPELADIALRHPGGGYYTEGGELEHIVSNSRKWAELTAEHFPEPEAGELVSAAVEAAKHLLDFGNWLEQSRDRMTGRYFLDERLINWYNRHVNLIPYTTGELRLMAEMERARSLSYLQFEKHKNRHLPNIAPAKTYEEYLAWDDETGLMLRRWYKEHGEDLLSDRDYLREIRSEDGLYLMPFGLIAFPYEEKPGIDRILLVPADHWRARMSNMGFRTDPGVLHGHEYWPGHTYEGEIHRRNPCPVRRGHRDGVHSQGWCFYHEELPVALDFPFVRGPRARELPYINMLQRAERILLGLELLTGKITTDEAFVAFQERVPPLASGLGAAREEAFEEMEGVLVRGLDHCQTGKLQIFKLLADRKMQLKDQFNLKTFHDQLITLGSVPISLLRWEIAGLDDEVQKVWEPTRLSVVLQARSAGNANGGPASR